MVSIKQELSMMKPKNVDRDPRKPQKPPPASAPAPVPPLFRKLDWLALAITFGVIWTVYLLTLAPELTLEDSGELVTGAFYAGIPHPPGYPVWSIYSWLWTALLPIGNIAWRVSVGQAFSGAMACGLLALLVSRGSSMFMEGIEELKEMTGKWESAICLISAVAAGLLLGLDGFMWKESVRRQPHCRDQRAVVPGGAGLPAALDLRAPPDALRLLGRFPVRALHDLASKSDCRRAGHRGGHRRRQPEAGPRCFPGQLPRLPGGLPGSDVYRGPHVPQHRGQARAVVSLQRYWVRLAGGQRLAGHPDQGAGDPLEVRVDHGRPLGAGCIILSLHGRFGHDQSPDAVGIPPDGGRVLPCD